MSTHYESDNNNFASQQDAVRQAALWDLLSVYADGEADPAETTRIEAMLQQDPVLARELAFLRRTSTVVRTLAEVNPPATLREAIYARTTGRPTLQRRIGRTWDRLLTSFAPRPMLRLSLAGGACLAAGLVIALVVPHGRGPVTAVHQEPQMGTSNLALGAPQAALSASQPLIVTPAEALSPPPHHELAMTTLRRHLESHGPVMPQIVVRNTMVAPNLAVYNTPAPAMHTISHNPKLRIKLPTSEPMPLVMHNETPKAHGYDHNTSDDVAARYSHLPMMDQANQPQIITASDRTSNDSLGENIDTNREETVAAVDKKAETSVENAPKKHIRTVLLQQLPPDARRYLTSADIKRELDARNLGFNRTTMEGIKREEATFALIGGKF